MKWKRLEMRVSSEAAERCIFTVAHHTQTHHTHTHKHGVRWTRSCWNLSRIIISIINLRNPQEKKTYTFSFTLVLHYISFWIWSRIHIFHLTNTHISKPIYYTICPRDENKEYILYILMVKNKKQPPDTTLMP